MLRDHGASLEEVILDDRTMARALQDEMDRRREKIRVRWHNGAMPVFDMDDVAGQIDTALAPRIALASGVEVLFEPGETLCAVDVDSASAGGRQGRAPRRPVEVNLEAAPAIAQQLRLRNIAGAVVIDFVTMRSTYDRDKVQAALAEALHGRTALVIAHRLSTIRAADQILVIEDGLVVERGTHDDLLAAHGRYAQLYNTQFTLV